MTRAVVALAVLAVVVGSFTGTVAAETPYADPTAVCEGQSQQLVVLLENGDTDTDSVAVFTGTELQLVYCSAEGDMNSAETTDAWGLGDVDGLEVTERNNRSITVDAVGPMDAVDLAEHVEQQSADQTAAPTLTVVDPSGTDTGYLGQPSEVRFSDDETRSVFIDARSEYTAAVEDARSLASEFDEAAAADDPANALETSTVAAAENRTAAVGEQSSRIQRLFVRAAESGADEATAAYFAQRDHSTAAASELRSAADSYLAAVESQATDARLFVTGILLGPFVGGVLVGAVAGRAVSRRDLKRIRRQRRRDRTVEYSLGNLWKVLVGAMLALAAAVAVLVVGTDLGSIIAVVT